MMSKELSLHQSEKVREILKEVKAGGSRIERTTTERVRDTVKAEAIVYGDGSVSSLQPPMFVDEVEFRLDAEGDEEPDMVLRMEQYGIQYVVNVIASPLRDVQLDQIRADACSEVTDLRKAMQELDEEQREQVKDGMADIMLTEVAADAAIDDDLPEQIQELMMNVGMSERNLEQEYGLSNYDYIMDTLEGAYDG